MACEIIPRENLLTPFGDPHPYLYALYTKQHD